MNNQQIKEYFTRLRTDFQFYCSVNIPIKNKAGKLVNFIFNRMQQQLWKWFLEDLSSGKPIRWYVLKGRQMGSTLFFTALFYWLTSLNSNKNACVIAQDKDAAEALGGKIQNYYQRSQPMLKPSVRIMNRSQIHFSTPIDEFEKTGEIGLDCHIDSFPIERKNLGRSYTYQYGLLTEYSMYEEVVEDVPDRMDSLLNTIGDFDGTVVIKETTPKGEGYAKKDWEDTQNGFRKIFISWVSMDEYRIEIPISEYFQLSELDTPESRYGDEIAERLKIIHELAIWWPELTTDFEIEHEVMCRLAWRRYMIDKKLSGKKLKFKQEYPTSVQDAFSYSADSVFPVDRLLEMEDFITKNKISPSLYRYHHDDVEKDSTKKFYAARYGHLSIFEPPKPNTVYCIGADGAQGIPNGDDSSAYVLKLPEMQEVACFSDIILPEEFAGVLNYLGLLYNKAILGCEINDKGGFAAVEKLVNTYYYPNLYYRINPLKSVVETNIRYGWVTDPNTRQVMINDFTSLLNSGNILIKSKKLLTQCKSFVMIKGKAQASPGQHDDLVIAAMIAVQMARQAYIPRESVAPKNPPKFSFEWHMRNMGKSKGQRETFNRKFV